MNKTPPLDELRIRRTHERLRSWQFLNNHAWAWDLRSAPLRVYTPGHTYKFDNLTELNNWLDALELVHGAE